jgi:hypothetical protein
MMSDVMNPLRSMIGAMRSFWIRGRQIERAGYVAGALLIVSGLIHLGILVITGGSWVGPLSLRKPTTFGLSFGLTLVTITWTSSFLRIGNRTRAVLLGAFTTASVLETALISLQAWRGVPSHFNVETPFDALVTRALAAGGIVLIAIIIALAISAFRENPTVPISLRVAIRIGFVSLLASLVVGASMIAKGMSLVFGGDPQAAYATGGALKPIHAVTMHAILVLPMLAWLLSFANWSEQVRLRLVLAAASGFVVLTGGVAAATLLGLELWQLPVTTMVLFAFGALSLLAIGLLALRGVARAHTADGIQHS